MPTGGYCEVHGVAHGLSGCALCRHEVKQVGRDRQHGMRRQAQFLLAPLVVALLGVGVALFRSVDPHLDPVPHRTTIETLESVLYQTDPWTEPDRDLFARAANALVADLATTIPPDSPQRQTAQAIRTVLSQKAAAVKSEPHLDIASMRAEWEALRNRSFRHVGWFRETSPGLSDGQAMPARTGPDVKRYNDVLFQLAKIAARADRDSAPLPQRLTDTSNPAVASFIDTTIPAIRAEIAGIRQGLPDAPALNEPAWQAAYDGLLACIDTAEAVCTYHERHGGLARFEIFSLAMDLRAQIAAVGEAMTAASR